MCNKYPFSDLPTIEDAVATPLKDLLGEHYYELVNDFTSNFPVKFNELKSANNSNDVESIFTISHTLKSSSGSFGFTKLFKRLEHLEHQARNNQIVNIDEQIELLDQEFNTILSSLDTE